MRISLLSHLLKALHNAMHISDHLAHERFISLEDVDILLDL